MALEVLSHCGAANAHRPALLFVHGGFHGAWCWEENFLPWFAARGWDAHALSLRGHARADDPDAELRASLEDYDDDVLSTVGALNRPIVVVGHSMGGVIAQRCLARSERIVGAVFLASSPLRPAFSVFLRILCERPWSFFRAQALGDRAALRRAMSAFFFDADLSPEVRDRYVAQLTAESPIHGLFSRPPPFHAGSDTRPILVAAGKEDWSIPMADHERLRQAYRADLMVFPGAHDLMLSPEWEQTANGLHDWLAARFDTPSSGG